MKKQFNVVKSMLMLVVFLLCLQIILLLIEFDITRIVLTCVVFLGFIANLIFYIICKKEVAKIIFESDDDLIIRLVDEDDFQLVRLLLDKTPLENSPEECKRLSYYQSVTIDFTRLHYHYIVMDKDEILCIFYAKTFDKTIEIEFKNEFDRKEEVKKKLLETKTNYQILFKGLE